MSLNARMHDRIAARKVSSALGEGIRLAGLSAAVVLGLTIASVVPAGAQAQMQAQAPGQAGDQSGAQPGREEPAGAVDHPVLLELYTAQGCASCPPADEMMLDLASREDVIALALHVDYWDYIGWTDTFASRDNTERQQRYARRYGHSTIYTPQVVINGLQILEGFRVMEVMDTIATQRERMAEVELELVRNDGALEIRAEPTENAAPQIAMASRRSAISGMATNSVVGTLSMSRRAQADRAESADDTAGEVAADAAGAAPESVASAAAAAPQAETPRASTGITRAGTGPFLLQLIRYRPVETVDIHAGENAGRTMRYANIVTSWEPLGSWDMMTPLRFTVDLPGDEPAVVIIQEAGQGEIVAAARLR
ncbi:DUF1223 domain-containing protein [Pararhodobacter marinus]|uniref:DUF1223 domain-containing protein n=1 Tax=Pararhodobacter marinus TaxID=2184063 RepID=UPI0035160B35